MVDQINAYIYQKRGFYYFSRRVPKELHSQCGSKRIVLALNTRSRAKAMKYSQVKSGSQRPCSGVKHPHIGGMQTRLGSFARCSALFHAAMAEYCESRFGTGPQPIAQSPRDHGL